MVSSTPRPHFTPGKDPVPILQEVGWAPGPVWTGGKSRPHRDSIPNRTAHSQSLYRLSYRAHCNLLLITINYETNGINKLKLIDISFFSLINLIDVSYVSDIDLSTPIMFPILSYRFKICVRYSYRYQLCY